jgi:MFS family permease
MTSAVYLAYAAEISIVPLHASQMWDATPWDLGLLFSAASATSLLATPLGGYLADRIGYKSVILPSSIMLAAGFAATSVAGMC